VHKRPQDAFLKVIFWNLHPIYNITVGNQSYVLSCLPAKIVDNIPYKRLIVRQVLSGGCEMRRIFLSCLLVLAFFSFSLDAHALNPIRVEVLFMNHGPMQPTVKQMRELFSGYGDRIDVTWYDLDTREGQQFMTKKGLREHIPLMIWIDGNVTVRIGQKETRFTGFPAGSGPDSFQGKWTMQDLKAALDQATVRKR
jgi:hypothetical protein